MKKVCVKLSQVISYNVMVSVDDEYSATSQEMYDKAVEFVRCYEVFPNNPYVEIQSPQFNLVGITEGKHGNVS